MPNDPAVSRRSALFSAGAIALGGAAPETASAQPRAGLELDDPRRRAMLRAKVMGSVAEQKIYIFYRLHIYAYLNADNLVPLFTMNNLNVTNWKPLLNGNYSAVGAECGVYCRFDSDEVLDVWENPITLERRRVWEFLGGPLKAEIGPDGIITGGVAELKPQSLRMEVLADMLFVPGQSDLSYPDPFQPKPAGGAPHALRFWDSHSVYAARVDDLLDPAIAAAPAFCQFQNLGSWHPWLGMADRAGRTYGKAYGAKLKSLDDLPRKVRAGLELKTPEIFSFDHWSAPHIDAVDYLASHPQG